MPDTREFELQLENSETDKIMANQIAANLYSQLDSDGCYILQFKCIISHNKDGYALTNDVGFTVLKGGYKKCKLTACVWKVLVEW